MQCRLVSAIGILAVPDSNLSHAHQKWEKRCCGVRAEASWRKLPSLLRNIKPLAINIRLIGTIYINLSHSHEFDCDFIPSKQPEYLVHLPQDSKQLPAKATITRDSFFLFFLLSFCYPAMSFLFTVSAPYVKETYTSRLFSGQKRECITVTSPTLKDNDDWTGKLQSVNCIFKAVSILWEWYITIVCITIYNVFFFFVILL